MNLRIGLGYDVHRLHPGRKLILGGVEIPHKLGLMGHSDADVLCHAIIDALLGALALGDIGLHFPDNTSEYKDVSSRILLKKTFDLISDKGYCINNIDATICAQYPRLQPYITQMSLNIASDLETEPQNVSIKATTEENLGVSGEEKGMAAYAIVLLAASKK
jgi:2-C-methyl-D-erythritol 2,4-cyclodiphosphate synthase